MRPIDADALMEKLDIKADCVECSGKDSFLCCSRGSYFVDACEAINEAPTIKTKQIKYYDDDENVWKVGEVIVDE